MEYRKGRALVFTQFLLITLIVLFGALPDDPLRLSALMLGIFLGLWAIAAMQLKVSIFPEPGRANKVIVAGPYKLIRHPMYTAVLLSTAAFIGGAATSALWVLLLAVLSYKLAYEEALLLAKFPEYKAYMAKTKRLVPFVY